MKYVVPLVLLLSLPSASIGQEASPDADPGDINEGIDLLEEGARTLLRGLMGEVEPTMRELADTIKEWDFNGLGLDDLGQYHPPVKLPNGDIIIRRKSPLDSPLDGEVEI